MEDIISKDVFGLLKSESWRT